MLYLGLDELRRDDYYSLLAILSHNQQLEFKHVIYLIMNSRIDVSKPLLDHIQKKEEFKWCAQITPDFEFTEPID